MLKCDGESGLFTWSGADGLGWGAWLEVDGQRLESADAEVTATDGEGDASVWTLRFAQCPVRWEISGVAEGDGTALRLCSRIYNDGDSPAMLGQATLFDTDDLSAVASGGDDLSK